MRRSYAVTFSTHAVPLEGEVGTYSNPILRGARWHVRTYQDLAFTMEPYIHPYLVFMVGYMVPWGLPARTAWEGGPVCTCAFTSVGWGTYLCLRDRAGTYRRTHGILGIVSLSQSPPPIPRPVNLQPDVPEVSSRLVYPRGSNREKTRMIGNICRLWLFKRFHTFFKQQ